MLGFLAAPEVIAFSAAFVLLLLIGLVEALGLGASALDLHLHLDVGGHDLLSWLGIGKVPLLILIVAFLASFAGIGLAGEQTALAMNVGLISPWVAIPAAAVAALPISAIVASLLARLMPQLETTAFPLDGMVGLTGVITIGRAAHGSPARARVSDPHGQAHHILVEPDVKGAVFEAGDEVLIVRREKDVFRAIFHSSPRYSNWIEG